MSTAITIVMYHYVRPLAGSRYPAINGLELKDFEGQLDYIEWHYSVVSVADVVAAANGGDTLPDRPLLLSFDDGYSDHYRHVFPALMRRGLRGVFFPPACSVLERKVLDVNKIHFVMASTDDHAALVDDIEREVDAARDEFELSTLSEYRKQFWQPNRFDTAQDSYIKRMLQRALPERLRNRIVAGLFRRYVSADESDFADELYASERELAEMLAAGMEIGSHGYAHYWLDSISPPEQSSDIDRSLDMLERIGGSRDGFYFCYPYGAYTGETLRILRQLGCAAAFTTEVGLARLGASSTLELPRLDTNDLPRHGTATPSRWTERAIRRGSP